LVTVTINGNNDAPVLTLGTVSNGIEEDVGGSYATLTTTKTDIDIADVASFLYGNNGWKLSGDGLTISRQGNFGTATVNISGGNVTSGGVLLTPGQVVYQLNDALTETNALTSGQTDTDTFLLTAKDLNGGTHTQQITFDVTGADDAATGWTTASPAASLYLIDNTALGFTRVAVRVGTSGLDVDSGVTYLGQIRTAGGTLVGQVELVASDGALYGGVAKGSMAVGTSYNITVSDSRSGSTLTSISVTGVALSALTDVAPTQASGYQLATGTASNEESAGSQYTTYNAATDAVVPATFLGNSGNDFFVDLRTGEAFAGGVGVDSALVASSRAVYTDKPGTVQLPAYSVAMLDAATVRKFAETTQYGSDVLPGVISTEFSQAVAGTGVAATQAVAVAIGYTDQTALTKTAFTDAEQLIFTSATNTVDRAFTLGQDSDSRLQLKLSDLGDRLVAGSGLTDNVDGGLGNDVIYGAGGGTGTLYEVLRGGHGDDVLSGGQSNVAGGYAKLIGGQGDDVLVAMGGVVEATGGTGRDVFALWDNTSSVQLFIKDFNASVDKLDLSALSSALTAVNAQTQTTGLQQLQQSIATFYAQQPSGVLQLDLTGWLTSEAKAGGATASVSIELEQSGGVVAGGQFSVDNIAMASTAWSPSLWKEDLSLLVSHA
jgi:VCBS repeat-containing protein